MRLNSRIFSSVSMRSFILGAVIVLACLAFIFTGFGSLHLSNLSGLNPNMAAKVGSQEIGMNQFSNQLTSQGISRYPENERKPIELQILNRMIGQKILVEQAQKMGWKASDSEIAVLIRTVPFFQDPATKQFSMEKFKKYVASQQMSDVDFYNELRAELELQKMQNLLFMPETVSNEIVNLQYAINNTQFSLQYVLIDPSESMIQDQITDKASKFLNNAANQAQLQAAFQNQKSKFESPAQVKVQSILIAYKTATRAQGVALTRTKQQAYALVQDLEKKLKAGANFAKLATGTNDDLISKQNQGSLGFVDSTNIDPISAKSVLALTQKNPLSEIVDTPFGYRIFAYQDSKKAVHKTFDEVKLDLARQIVADQIKLDLKTNLNTQISQALSAHNISKLNQIMSDAKMSWKYISKPYKVTDPYISELGSTSDLAQNVFYLKKSGDLIFSLIHFGNGKLAVIKLVSRTDPVPPSDQDRNELKKQIATSDISDFAQTVQKNLMARYQKEGDIAINPAIKGY